MKNQLISEFVKDATIQLNAISSRLKVIENADSIESCARVFNEVHSAADLITEQVDEVMTKCYAK
ncbi:MAG: hypothetical protein A2Y12_19140 [Planctomycetes bacterium GWF2_42_9]|nr:MAG: hypothetical protein A2Y12_19140 [Planctomycetes bacterium GWF2_42_9]